MEVGLERSARAGRIDLVAPPTVNKVQFLPQFPDPAVECVEQAAILQIHQPRTKVLQPKHPRSHGQRLRVLRPPGPRQTSGDSLRQRIGFRPLPIRQIKTIREGHQIIKTQRSSYGGESRPPGLQTLEKRSPGIPYTVGREVGPERMDRHEVQRKLRIGIEQNSPHRLFQLQGSSGIRTAEKAATIVIIGEEIIPDEWRTAQDLGQPSERV